MRILLDTLQHDFVLLEELRGGNEDALAILYKTYAPILLDFIYRRTDHDEISREIVQEIFVSLWQKRFTVEIETSLRQYLFGAAKLRILDYRRRSKVKQSYLVALAMMSGEAVSNAIDDQISVDHILQEIEDTLLRLPQKVQIVFRLSRFEHKTIREIAGRLHISRRTVENYISFALSELRSALNSNK